MLSVEDCCSLDRNFSVGYVYLTFEMERSVKALLQASIQGVCGSGEYYYRVTSRRTKNKEVSLAIEILSSWCYLGSRMILGIRFIFSPKS